MTETTLYDAIVIGGGAAGLSAATTLGRARRSVLVIDAGQPRNAPAAGVHGFLSRDGMPPRDLLEIGRQEAASYGVTFVDAEATAAERVEGSFVVRADQTYRSRRLVVATGLIDELPEVAGLAERWGRDVVHCPYCHGWEIRDQVLGVIGTGPTVMHQVLLFRQWSARVTLFTHTAPALTAEQLEQLAARGVAVIEGRVASVTTEEDRLSGVVMNDGTRHPLEAIAVGSRMLSRDDVLVGLGLQAAAHPSGMGTQVDSGVMGATTVEGVWVAGNVSDVSAQVIVAAADGMRAGAAINADLVAEDTRQAVNEYRARSA